MKSSKTSHKKQTARRTEKKTKTASLKKKSTASQARGRAGAKKKINSRSRLEFIRQSLIQKREALTRHLQSELRELETTDKHHLADLEEMASDINDTESLCEIMHVGNKTLGQIDQALGKIEEGTYGLCEDCGEDIPFERLEALPFATVCVACQRRREAVTRRW